jgi:hypothetical protein
MVRAGKQVNALYALHGVLLQARDMARAGRPDADIAEVLGVAQYLVTLLLEQPDKTLVFRGQLTRLAERFPVFGVGLERFDALPPKR